jgi:hypothetical protein
MSSRSGGRSGVAWFLACTALAGVIGFEVSNGLPLAPEVTAAPAAAGFLRGGGGQAPGFAGPEASLVDTILARPLFLAARRPQAPGIDDNAPAKPLAAQSGGSLELVGTMVSGRSRIAMIGQAGNEVTWLREGQVIEGWRIAAIGQAQVRLERQGESRDLPLRESSTTPRPAVKAKAQPAKPEPEVAKMEEEKVKAAAEAGGAEGGDRRGLRRRRKSEEIAYLTRDRFRGRLDRPCSCRLTSRKKAPRLG